MLWPTGAGLALIVGTDRHSDAIMLACGRVRPLGYDNVTFVVGMSRGCRSVPVHSGPSTGRARSRRTGCRRQQPPRAEVIRVACTPSDGRNRRGYGQHVRRWGQYLAQLRANNPDILAAAVVTTDGFAVEADTSAEIDEDSLAAMAADLLARASRSSQEFGNGALDELYARGEQGYLLVARAGSEQVLACLASADATVGLLLRDVRQAAAKIAD